MRNIGRQRFDRLICRQSQQLKTLGRNNLRQGGHLGRQVDKLAVRHWLPLLPPVSGKLYFTLAAVEQT